MDYQHRIIDEVLDELFPELVAISLEGAKGVGKTATAARRVNTVLSLIEPQTRMAVAGNFDLVVDVTPPVFIDEWQLEPQVWDRVRIAVDDNPTASGRFLLAGSAGLAPGTRVHSGAGRIVRFLMRPMALSERGIEQPTVSLKQLHAGDASIAGSSSLTVKDYVDEILRSGFPGIRTLSERARNQQLDSYIDRIVDHDLPENGTTVRRPVALLAWLRAYGAATASSTDYTKILDAATAGESDKPARNTVDNYREHLRRLFILDPVEAWSPSLTPLKRLAVAPKHHLVDPALAARMVGVGAAGLLRGDGAAPSPSAGTWAGALFESLAVQSVRSYAEAMGARIGHLRTKAGDREIDIIVETNDRRIVALEVKLSDTINDHDVTHLLWLKQRLGSQVSDAIVLNTGKYAYRRRDGVGVVPLALLGP